MIQAVVAELLIELAIERLGHYAIEQYRQSHEAAQQAAETIHHKRRERQIGDGGEIRIGGLSSRTTRTLEKTKQGRAIVTYAKLKTAAQARRANEIQNQLFGPGT